MNIDVNKIQSLLNGEYSSLDGVLGAIDLLSEIVSALNEKVIPCAHREAFEMHRGCVKCVNLIQYKKVTKTFKKVETKLREMEDAVFLMEEAARRPSKRPAKSKKGGA